MELSNLRIYKKTLQNNPNLAKTEKQLLRQITSLLESQVLQRHTPSNIQQHMRQSGLWFEHNIVANQQTTQPQLDQKMQLIKVISLLSQHLANPAKTLAETKLSIVQGKDNQYSMLLSNNNTSPFIEIKPSLNETLPLKPQIANYLIAQSQKPTVTAKLVNFTNTPATLVNPTKQPPFIMIAKMPRP